MVARGQDRLEGYGRGIGQIQKRKSQQLVKKRGCEGSIQKNKGVHDGGENYIPRPTIHVHRQKEKQERHRIIGIHWMKLAGGVKEQAEKGMGYKNATRKRKSKELRENNN